MPWDLILVSCLFDVFGVTAGTQGGYAAQWNLVTVSAWDGKDAFIFLLASLKP